LNFVFQPIQKEEKRSSIKPKKIIKREKEPKPVAASISPELMEDNEVSKTETAAMDVKQEMLTSKYIAVEVADRKDKSKSAKSKKWVTPSMLKNIRPVF